MTSLIRVLVCFALLFTCAWGATIQAFTQYDLNSSSGGCCPSGFDQTTVQVTPTETIAQAAVSRSNYARANAIAQFSSDGGIRLGAYSYAHTSNSFDASIGGAATWAGVQAQAAFFDNITVVAGQEGKMEWTFALHGTLASTPGGCPVISNGRNLCSAHLDLVKFTQGIWGERVVGFSVVGGAQVIDQLVTINVPFTVGVAHSVGFGIYASTVCDGGYPPYRNCESLSDFANTATLVGFRVLDTQGNVLNSNVVVQSESGFDYFSVNVPEPSSFVLLLSGFVVVLSRRLPGTQGRETAPTEARGHLAT